MKASRYLLSLNFEVFYVPIENQIGVSNLSTPPSVIVFQMQLLCKKITTIIRSYVVVYGISSMLTVHTDVDWDQKLAALKAAIA